MSSMCLAGDDSPLCIGVLKEQIPQGDDEKVVLSYGIYSPLRPDVQPIVLTKPTSFDKAIGVLTDQRLAMDDMGQLVNEGKLQDAGVVLLRILPRVTIAGRYIVAAPKFAPQIHPLFDQAEAAVASLDKTMGRGVGRRMGATAMAQLQILSELSTTKLALDNLIISAKSAT